MSEPILCAGIDGGQSSTTAILGDARGRVLARASGPPAALVGLARDSGRQAQILDGVLAEALAAAGLPSETRFAAVVAGISGYDEGESATPVLSARVGAFHVVHDALIAHAGALDGAAGIVVIGGTGSVAIGCDPPGSALVRAGGWGPLFGDEGGAFWIARTALRRAMWRADLGERSLLEARALVRFGTASLRGIQHGAAHGEIERRSLAAFAPEVLSAAKEGDADARDVRGAAARELADLARAVDRRLPPAALRLVSYVGGLFADDAFSEAFQNALISAVPHAEIVPPVDVPAGGALRLACRAAGLSSSGSAGSPA
jgi:N-acetylglucosamine kinase-like BadF-type ATPase